AHPRGGERRKGGKARGDHDDGRARGEQREERPRRQDGARSHPTEGSRERHPDRELGKSVRQVVVRHVVHERDRRARSTTRERVDDEPAAPARRGHQRRPAPRTERALEAQEEDEGEGALGEEPEPPVCRYDREELSGEKRVDEEKMRDDGHRPGWGLAGPRSEQRGRRHPERQREVVGGHDPERAAAEKQGPGRERAPGGPEMRPRENEPRDDVEDDDPEKPLGERAAGPRRGDAVRHGGPEMEEEDRSHREHARELELRDGRRGRVTRCGDARLAPSRRTGSRATGRHPARAPAARTAVPRRALRGARGRRTWPRSWTVPSRRGAGTWPAAPGSVVRLP